MEADYIEISSFGLLSISHSGLVSSVLRERRNLSSFVKLYIKHNTIEGLGGRRSSNFYCTFVERKIFLDLADLLPHFVAFFYNYEHADILVNCLVQHLLHTIVRFWREQAQLSWNAACQNTDGSFTCECLSSFTGVGVQCTLGKEMFLDCVPSIGKKATLFCMADFIWVSFVHQLQRTAQNSTNLAAKRAGSSQSVRTTSRSFAFSATKPRQEGAGLSSRKDSTDPSTSTETGQATNQASVTWAASSGSGWKTSTDWQVRPTTNCELSWRTLTGTRLTQSTTRLLWQTKQTSTGCAWGATKVTSFLRFILCSEWTVRSETVTHCQPLFCRSSQCFLRTGVTCSVPLSGELGLNAARFRVVLRLSVSLAGTAGDSLARHNRMAFSTKDRDNDQDDGRDCARSLKRRLVVQQVPTLQPERPVPPRWTLVCRRRCELVPLEKIQALRQTCRDEDQAWYFPNRGR